MQGIFYLEKDKIISKFPDSKKYIKKLHDISSKNNLNLSQLSLLFTLMTSEIANVIIGVDSKNQLLDHISMINKSYLNQSTYSDILDMNFNNENMLNPSRWS